MVYFCKGYVTQNLSNKHRLAFFAYPRNQVKICYCLYLGHIINNKLSDSDIEREMKNLFGEYNMLCTRFNVCSTAVKCVLFNFLQHIFVV